MGPMDRWPTHVVGLGHRHPPLHSMVHMQLAVGIPRRSGHGSTLVDSQRHQLSPLVERTSGRKVIEAHRDRRPDKRPKHVELDLSFFHVIVRVEHQPVEEFIGHNHHHP